MNILGLAIGIAGALLVALWLENMLSTDRFHEKQDRLYIMSNRDMYQGEKFAWSWTPKIMGPTLQEEYPEVESFTSYRSGFTFLIAHGEKKLMKQGSMVDPGFFDLFSFPIIAGDKRNLLKDAKSIVLTESFSKSLFGDENPIGKTVKIDSSDVMNVQAVLKDLPNNTSMDFDYLVSWEYGKQMNFVDSNWLNNTVSTYVLLKEGTSLPAFNKKVKLITQEHFKSDANPAGIKATLEVFAFPFGDSFLYNNGAGGTYKSGRIDTVKLISWVGIFILLVACINYMNLSTARSEKRAKEIAVRKVIGANRRGLIFQFLIESLLITFVSFVISIILLVLVLPAFNSLLGKNLSISFLDGATWLKMVAWVLFVGLFAGIYPAFIISSFKPLKGLKGKLNSYKGKLSFRSILVVMQFAIAIILIISTIIISKQIEYTKDRDQGYNQSNLLYTEFNGSLKKNYELIRQELLASNVVESVSKTYSPVTMRYSNSMGYRWTGATPDDLKVSFNRFSVDADLIKTFKMQLVSGREIDIYKFSTDSNAVMLTETAVKKMNLKNPLETEVIYGNRTYKVVGVIKDFIIDSPFQGINPMIIEGAKSFFSTIHYRMKENGNLADQLKIIEPIFKKYNPDYPFEFKFVDKEYETKFEFAQSIGTLSKVFAGLTIFISCLGLLALISYMAEIRTKEIAVRKVLGASFTQLTTLLSKDFLSLIIVSILIGSPIAWWVMNNWLNEYSYKIEIKWYYFLIAGLCSIVLCLLTIGYQTIKAAVANPVDSLRDE